MFVTFQGVLLTLSSSPLPPIERLEKKSQSRKLKQLRKMLVHQLGSFSEDPKPKELANSLSEILHLFRKFHELMDTNMTQFLKYAHIPPVHGKQTFMEAPDNWEADVQQLIGELSSKYWQLESEHNRKYNLSSM